MCARHSLRAFNTCAVCGHEWTKRSAIPPRRCPECNSTLWNCSTLINHCCKRCGHKWFGREENPVRCPKCRSKRWDADLREYVCDDCGHTTEYREGRCVPPACPACGSRSWRTTGLSTCSASPVGGKIADVVRNVIDTVSEPALRVRSLVKQGMDDRDAEVCLRYLSGENELDIAWRMNITYEDVCKRVSLLRK